MPFDILRSTLAGFILLLSCFVNDASASLILNINAGGKLLGASGIEVNGGVFDVQFLDGSCSSLFNGCDESVDFTWNTVLEASNASQALLDNVFIDGLLGNFDSNPSLTFGISSTLFSVFVTPYSPSVNDALFAGARNNALSDSVYTNRLNKDVNPTSLFAVWSISPPSLDVPEPSTLAIFALGMIGLASRRFKKQS